MDQFLLRQNWRADAQQLRYRDQLFMPNRPNPVNKWFYLLACLNDDTGRRFRREHASYLMELADNYNETGLFWHPEIAFIFADPRLAKEYWPRFAQRLGRSPLTTCCIDSGHIFCTWAMQPTRRCSSMFGRTQS